MRSQRGVRVRVTAGRTPPTETPRLEESQWGVRGESESESLRVEFDPEELRTWRGRVVPGFTLIVSLNLTKMEGGTRIFQHDGTTITDLREDNRGYRKHHHAGIKETGTRYTRTQNHALVLVLSGYWTKF